MTLVVELPEAIDGRLPPDMCIIVNNGSAGPLMVSGEGDRDEQWTATRSCNKKAQ